MAEPAKEPVGAPSVSGGSPSVADFGAKSSAASSLRAETSKLDRARSAIAAGNPRTGLAELDRYDAAFPHGALAPEAALLRIKALVSLGDLAHARELARAFATAHPRAPNLEQLRSLLEP